MKLREAESGFSLGDRNLARQTISNFCEPEADAFRRLQRGAMNRRVPMVDLAQSILNGEQVDLGPG